MVLRFKLKANYSSWPTWYADGVRVGDFDPAQLPISQETLQRLLKWQEVYDSTYQDDYPYNSSFPSQEAREIWGRERLRLWAQLHNELSSEYEVVSDIMHEGKIQVLTLEELPDEIKARCQNDIENASQPLL
ncbi:hypothetical protein [Leptolyngbya sp. 7M]|uniref:hypothetical protein n=1 Tax=Leptolyngbya sp. 7M TaxID=2812896 RepID=UPI001B8CD938|nr:hypothetical protein [Leptolyngbya sp. 7M]QYO62986.1 hypothetical protein JVX88_23730 [Leptolyngbya sp. 7M]